MFNIISQQRNANHNRYQYTLIRMTIIKILTITSASEDEEQLEFLYITGGMQNGTTTQENSLAVS